jgi:hypothetical protein
MTTVRRRASGESAQRYAADAELAGQFEHLLAAARAAEDELRGAQAVGAPLTRQHELGIALDSALTAVMRAAYAAERAEIGPRGYDDWIYRRKARAKPNVRMWAAEAERLLTMREAHRLTGIVAIPAQPVTGPAAGPPGGHGGAHGSAAA